MTCMGIIQSCSDDKGDSYDEPGPKPAPTNAEIRLSNNAVLGSILTDSEGKTLYFFSEDTKDASECTGGCLDIWPIFYVDNLVLGEGLDAADFDTITRSDGEPQITYKDWPLYYYYDDNVAGDTNGENINNAWFAAKPDYSLMYAKAQLVGDDDNNYTSRYTVGEEMTSYIVDIDGRTLYTFINDTHNTNNFTNSDFSNNGVWPIAEITMIQIPSILDIADFGTIDVHGRRQLTYRGWPLYYFGQDSERGDTRGVSFPQPGVWPIANVDTETAPE